MYPNHAGNYLSSDPHTPKEFPNEKCMFLWMFIPSKSEQTGAQHHHKPGCQLSDQEQVLVVHHYMYCMSLSSFSGSHYKRVIPWRWW